ncbi:hypothetical protein IT575_14005 [bacterium]|nr:hypothetical protein [bacterium]
MRCAAALLLLLPLLGGCFGSAADRNAASPAEEQPAAESRPAADPVASRNVLRYSMPALASLSPGAEFDLVLSADFESPLHQASARFVYDSSVLEAVRAQRGALFPEDAVFLARTDMQPGSLDLAPALRQQGIDAAVPFAYTRLPEDPASGPVAGELLRLRFRLKAAPQRGKAALQMLSDQDWLQLRDSAGRRIAFNLESVEEATR